MKVNYFKIAILFLVLALLGAAFSLVPRKRSFSSYIRRGEEAYQKKEFAQSVELYLTALKYYPNHEKVPDILLTIGDIYNFSLGNTEKAGKAYDMLTQQYPKSLSALRGFQNSAEMYEKSDQFQKALLAYQGIIDHFPQFPKLDEIRFNVAMMAAKLKKFEPARRSLMSIIENNPETAIADQVLYQLGNTFFMEGGTREAIQVLEVAIQKYPESPLLTEMKFTLANAYEERAQHAEALKIYREILASYPNPMVIQNKIEKLSKRMTEGQQAKEKLLETKKQATSQEKTPPVKKKGRPKSLNDADEAIYPF